MGLSSQEENELICWDVVLSRQKQLERQFYSLQNNHTEQAWSYDLNND